jgi:thiol-disulfide isomerase/thioredoxin
MKAGTAQKIIFVIIDTMRYFLSLLLIIYINCSFGQTASDSSGQAKMWEFMRNNESSEAPDSIKRQNLYKELKAFIIKHPANERNYTFIFSGLNLTHKQVDTLVSFVDSSIKNVPAKVWADITLKRTSFAETGKPFPSLTLRDTSGNEFLLSSLKGKLVLLDVWSSWCGPCREQIPELRKLYKKYNSRGFEIIGISMDDNKQSWLKAIREDKQAWKQYCELVNWRGNKFAARFYTYTIPDNFLIDENGILVGQNLSAEVISSWVSQHY